MNFPGVDLLDQAIFDTLVDDSTLLGLHLQLELHGFGGQEGNDSKAPITWSFNASLSMFRENRAGKGFCWGENALCSSDALIVRGSTYCQMLV